MPQYIISRPTNAGPFETVPPLSLNGRPIPYEWDEPTELTDDAVRAALNAGFKVSPANSTGNGDAAAEALGGDTSGSDTSHPLDHDGDGSPGGSLPADPPTLTGKKKAELLAIAADEGVEANPGMTIAQITAAITDARNS